MMSRRNGGPQDYAPVDISSSDHTTGSNGRNTTPSPPLSPRSVQNSIGPAVDAVHNAIDVEDRRKPRSNIPSLVCAILASMTTGGTTYAFGLYGADLKAALKLKPSELDTLSTAFFVAGLVSWLPGLFVDRFGTRRGMIVGGSMGATSLVTYWLVSKKMILREWLFWTTDLQPHSKILVPLLSCLGILIFLSCALVTASVFKIIVATSGPGTKGSAVGVAKGYVGLGAGAYACLLEALRYPKQSHLDFLPMAGFFFVMCAVLPSLILLPTKEQMERDLVFEDEATPLHFRAVYGSLCAMATIIVLSSMLALSDGQESHQNFWVAFLIVAVWIGPILCLLWLPRRKHHQTTVVPCPVRTEGVGSSDLPNQSQTVAGLTVAAAVDQASVVDTRGATEPIREEQEEVLLLLSDEDIFRRRSSVSQQQHESIHVPERVELNTLQMLQTPSALLMLWTCTLIVGSGTVETNNMGQMVEAMGFSASVAPASLALFSVAQSASRVATGTLSEAALGWNTKRFGIDNGVPRPAFFVLASMVAFIGHGVLSVSNNEFGFVLGVTLSGIAFGTCWPLLVLVSGEVFGTANAAANYMFYDGFTSAMGTLLLTKGLSQHVYEDHIDPASIDPDTCYGKDCFQLTHVVIALLSLTCVVTSTSMVYTSRYAYIRPMLSVH
ncbi:hypothetical protein MPSEU_000348000 [Mayamaea pseudoterrestris]|nr:hypothetical protein MPSEU_000348000 [Mayamaea pseudoterrestris]